MTDFYAAAQTMFAQHGWISHPQRLDASGKPKVPIVAGWPQLRSIEGLPWDQAKGIGIVLGPTSNNLAVIDVDDVEMADAVFALVVRGHVETRMGRTISNHLHVYFREQQSSASTAFKVQWRGRSIGIELKAKGTQVTCPPTPGYEPVGIEEHLDGVKEVPNLRAAWEPIAARLGIEMPPPAAGRTNGAGFPSPWQAEVPAGERNRAMYVEAHKLKRAGIAEDEALALLRTRFETSYEPGESNWEEMAATIASAYRKDNDREEARVAWSFS